MGHLRVPGGGAHLLPDDLAGLDAIELGCGTGYMSAATAGEGRRRWGSTTAQAARDRGATAGGARDLDFPLIHGYAERVPLPDASFDFAISEYGAVLWADPAAWLPEAARLLRPGGRLHVLTNHILSMVATAEDAGEDDPLEERFARSYFRPTRVDWPDGTTWSSTPRMASGSACSATRASRSSSCSSRRRPRVRKPASPGPQRIGPRPSGDLEGPQARLSRAVRRWALGAARGLR